MLMRKLDGEKNVKLREIKLIMASRHNGKSIYKEKLKRHIEMGYIDGYIHESGAIIVRKNKKYIPYSTRELVTRVTEAFDRREKFDGKRICYINGKWQLQIRGKHLRRLLKAMPHVENRGRSLVDNGPVA